MAVRLLRMGGEGIMVERFRALRGRCGESFRSSR